MGFQRLARLTKQGHKGGMKTSFVCGRCGAALELGQHVVAWTPDLAKWSAGDAPQLAHAICPPVATDYERAVARERRARRRARFTTSMLGVVAGLIALWYLAGVKAWATARFGPAAATLAYLAAVSAPCLASVVAVVRGRRDR